MYRALQKGSTILGKAGGWKRRRRNRRREEGRIPRGRNEEEAQLHSTKKTVTNHGTEKPTTFFRLYPHYSAQTKAYNCGFSLLSKIHSLSMFPSTLPEIHLLE